MQIGRHSATFVSTSLEAGRGSFAGGLIKVRRLVSNLSKTRGTLPSTFLYFYCLDFIFTATVRANVVCQSRSFLFLFLFSSFFFFTLWLFVSSVLRVNDKMKRVRECTDCIAHVYHSYYRAGQANLIICFVSSVLFIEWLVSNKNCTQFSLEPC